MTLPDPIASQAEPDPVSSSPARLPAEVAARLAAEAEAISADDTVAKDDAAAAELPAALSEEGDAAADDLGDDLGDDLVDDREAGVRRRTLPAAALSWLFPGLGQLVVGRRVAALLFAVPTLAFIAWVALQFDQGAAFFAVSLWDDAFFASFIVAVVAFGLWRLLAVLHLLALGIRGRRWRLFDSVVAFVLVLTIVTMHGALAGGAYLWYEASVQIQQNDFFAAASPTDTPTAAASATPTASPTIPPTPKPKYSFPWALAPDPTNPYPTSAPTNPPNPRRITFLLIGVDFMDGRSHSLTDSLMVVSVDTRNGRVSMISVPRDTSAFQMYYGPWVTYNTKINTLLSSVDQGRFKSPDRGITTLEKEIGFLVGIPINYYAAVDIDGFVKLVDAVGGVDVDNKHVINDPPFLELSTGPAHLDGNLAMRYVRSREHGGSDYLRAARQQEVLKNLEASITNPANVENLPNLLSIAAQNLSTDFPLKQARNYVKLGQKVKVTGCVLGPPYSWHPNSNTTGGSWTSRLDLNLVASLSTYYFGMDSLYWGQPGVKPQACLSNPN